MDLNVIKRNGETEVLSYDKIAQRIKQLNYDTTIQSSGLVMKIMDQLHDNILTSKIDELISEQCASMGIHHYDYSILAGRIIVSNHQKEVNPSFSIYINNIREIPNYISNKYYEVAMKHIDFFESILDHSRDYLIDYF
jgi:ribonucleoside-diphosphate reductase alpha chain